MRGGPTKSSVLIVRKGERHVIDLRNVGPNQRLSASVVVRAPIRDGERLLRCGQFPKCFNEHVCIDFVGRDHGLQLEPNR